MKGIIFNTDMVKAVLEDRKSQTRRLITGHKLKMIQFNAFKDVAEHCPYGKVGDRLWVRHSFYHAFKGSYNEQVWDEFSKVLTFKNPPSENDRPVCQYEIDRELWKPNKKPSIHMPRWASRITLEITDIRVERVQSISLSDAYREGMINNCCNGQDCGCQGEMPISNFRNLWDSIYGKDAWELNKHVWVITFKVVTNG